MIGQAAAWIVGEPVPGAVEIGMALQITSAGWLVGQRCRVSPNHDTRPDGLAVDALVVHGITVPPGQFGQGRVEALFTNQLPAGPAPVYQQLADVRVSAHVLIERTGRLTQFVSLADRAWHAGRSCLAGRRRVNDFSIGVELEGTDTCPYTPAQYRQLAMLAGGLLAYYPGLTRARIVGHSDIAPGRKTDPGPAFDWAMFYRLLDQTCT